MDLKETFKNWVEKRKQKRAKMKEHKKNMTAKEKVIENVKVFFSAYLIAFVIRLFLIEAYQIPSQSMVPSLMVRDILMVEKFSFGANIPLVNWKIPGFFKPDRNDIIVFITPDWESPGLGKEFISLITLSIINLDNTFDTPKNLVKRVVALPGDTISMSNKMLILNGELIEPEFIKTTAQDVYSQLTKMGQKMFDLYGETYSNEMRIVQHAKRNLTALTYSPDQFDGDDFFENFNSRYIAKLTVGFPEIYVPQKGDTISLTNINNYYLYLMKMLIERETDKVITVSDGKFYLEGKQLTEWTVADNYYFAMGDNRDSSKDCRYFGFIPEKNIFGRILFRYFPFNRFAFNVNEKAESVVDMDFTD